MVFGGWVTYKVVKYFILVWWIGACSFLFYDTYQHYANHPEYYYTHRMLGRTLCISRAAAAVLNLNVAVILLPMCRTFVTLFRNLQLKVKMRTIRILIDTCKGFHKFIAVIIAICSVLHLAGHVVNAYRFSVNYDHEYPSVNPAYGKSNKIEDLSPHVPSRLAFNIMVKNKNPIVIVFTSIPGLTGILMCIIILAIYFTSIKRIRSTRYNIFWYTHKLFLVFFILFLFHGLIGPLRRQTNTDLHIPGCRVITHTSSDNRTTTNMTSSVPASHKSPGNVIPQTDISIKKPKTNRTSAFLSSRNDKSSGHVVQHTEIKSPGNVIQQFPQTYNITTNKTKPPVTLSVFLPTRRRTTSKTPTTLMRNTTSHDRFPPPQNVTTSKYVTRPPTTTQSKYVTSPSTMTQARYVTSPPTVTKSIYVTLPPTMTKSIYVTLPPTMTKSIHVTLPPTMTQSRYVTSSQTVTMSENVTSSKNGRTPGKQKPPEEDEEIVLCSETPQFSHTTPKSWMWVLGPLLIYLIDLAWRLYHRSHDVTITSVKQLPADVIEVEFEAPSRFYNIGQFVLVSCPDISTFEWHPFSITKVPSKKSSTSSVHIRVGGDWTFQLQDKVREVNRDASKLESAGPRLRLRIDGPFNSPLQDMSKYSTVVCLAGGIGVTPFLSFLIDIGNSPEKYTDIKSVHLIWSCRGATCFRWFSSQLLHTQNQMMLSENKIELKLKFFCTELLEENNMENCVSINRLSLVEAAEAIGGLASKITNHFAEGAGNTSSELDLVTRNLQRGRPPLDVLLTDLTMLRDVGVFTCGPRPLIKSVRSIQRRHHKTTGHFQFYYETF